VALSITEPASMSVHANIPLVMIPRPPTFQQAVVQQDVLIQASGIK
jgi:hypothetical protein